MSLLRYVNTVFWDFLFPKCCILCDKQGSYICDYCRIVKFEPAEADFCHVCYQPGKIHDACIKKSSLDKVIAVVNYNQAAGKILAELKYNFYFAVAEDIATMMLAKLAEINIQYDTIIPVPLFRRRKWWRGFNQAELFASKLGSNDLNGLKRIKYKRPQVGLSRVQRQSNIKEAFVAGRSLVGKTILLVDDVFTTGSTLEECARVLKEARATKVYALVWACQLSSKKDSGLARI